MFLDGFEPRICFPRNYEVEIKRLGSGQKRGKFHCWQGSRLYSSRDVQERENSVRNVIVVVRYSNEKVLLSITVMNIMNFILEERYFSSL